MAFTSHLGLRQARHRYCCKRSERKHAALESKDNSIALRRTASLAPWSVGSQRDQQDIVLVQGPAGSGKSLFAWSLYSRFGSVCLRADFGDVWWWWSMQRKIQIWALLWCLSLNRCRSSPDSYVMKICVAEVVRQALRYHFLFIFHGARPVRRLRPASLGLAQRVRHHLAARLPV